MWCDDMVSHKKEVDSTVKFLLQIFPEEFIRKTASVMSTTQCRGTEGVKTDAKNDATAQKRGTFRHHEHETQNGF